MSTLAKLRTNRPNNEEGFSLLELVFTVAIIAVLAAITVPFFTGKTSAAVQSTVMQDTRTIGRELLEGWNEEDGFPTTYSSSLSGDNYANLYLQGAFDDGLEPPAPIAKIGPSGGAYAKGTQPNYNGSFCVEVSNPDLNDVWQHFSSVSERVETGRCPMSH